MIKNLLFDNDGTIYKVSLNELITEIVGAMIIYLSLKLQIPEHKIKEERKRLFKKYDADCTEYVFSMEYGLDYKEFINSTYLKLNLKKFGINEDKRLQEMLSRIKLRKSILTNNPLEFARKILKIVGVEDRFEHIIGSKEVDHELKPKKQAFIKALDITGYNPRETMFIDDVPEFHKAAKELGMTTVLIGSGNIPGKKGYIDYKIEKIYEVEQILKGKQNV